jgi:hypothetical protein
MMVYDFRVNLRDCLEKLNMREDDYLFNIV